MAIPNVPKIIAGQIDAGTIIASQYYNNPNSAYNGAAAYYFQVDLINPSSQYNMDDSANTPYEYNFADIEAGMWIAEQTGKAWLITDVTVAGDLQSAQLTIKDVNLFLFMSEPASFTFTYNYPSGTGYAIIFELSEDGIPVLPSTFTSYSGQLTDSNYWFSELITRFQYRNLLKSHYNNSTSPNANYANYEVGQMVYLDSNGVFQPLVASDAAQVKKRFGVITSVNEPEEGDLGVRPWGKIVGDLDLGAFTVGDALYYDDTVGAPFLTATEPSSSAIPMYIKISNTTGMYITDMVGGGGDQIYNSLFSNPTETVFTVGGVDAGTPVENLSGQTISQVLDQIFFPPTCPTPVQPTIGFSDSPDVVHSSITTNYLYLVGDILNSTFSFTASPGSVPDQGDFAGPIVSATLTLPDNTTVDVHSGSGFTMNNYNLTNYEVPLGIQNWEYSVVFGNGPAVLDSYGDPNCPSYLQSTIDTDRKLEGVYPVFLGTSATYTSGQVAATWEEAMGETGNTSWSPMALFSFVNNSSKAFTLSYQENNSAGSYVNHRIAVPAALGLSDIQQDSVITGISSIFGQFTTSNVNLTINGQSVSYVIYERTNAAPGDAVNYIITW